MDGVGENTIMPETMAGTLGLCPGGSRSHGLMLDTKSKVTNQFLDFQWKLGMAVNLDSCTSLKYPYVAGYPKRQIILTKEQVL